MSIQDSSKFIILTIALCFGLNRIHAQSEYNIMNTVLLDSFLKVENCTAINTKAFQYSPMFYKKGIVYIEGDFENKKDLEKGKVFFSLRYAPFDQNNVPYQQVPFAIDERSADHKGPVAFSNGDNLMYLSRTIEPSDKSSSRKNKDGQVMQIYALERGDTFWQNQQWLEFNDRKYTHFHPTINEAGNYIIFSSNRPGGFGAFDLWGSVKENGVWSEPFNLGPEINSTADEAYPFLYQDKYLFFSSERQGSMDIFYSEPTGDVWENAQQLPEPFKSDKDDIGFILDKDGKSGFFSSNRVNGQGNDDIYRFQFSTSLMSTNQARKPKTVNLLVKNEQTAMRLEDVQVWLYPLNENGVIVDKSAYQSVVNQNSDNGTMELNLIRKPASELKNPNFITDRNGSAKLVLAPETDYKLIAFKSGYDPIEMKVSSNSNTDQLDLALVEFQCLPLSIEAVNKNNQKTTHFNIKVRPIQTNNYTQYRFPEAEEICLQYRKTYEIIGYKEGHIPDTFMLPAQANDVKKAAVLFRLLPLSERSVAKVNQPEIKEATPSNLKKGTTIELKNIYYDYNKSSIQVGAEDDLDALVALMKQQPKMKIEMAAHTDSRGGELYNLRLSLRRAQSAKKYLVRSGIDTHRIRAVGYGESYIRNQCKNGVECSDDEHQTNRRTEIKILEMDDFDALNIEYKD